MTQYNLDTPINPATKSGTQLADDLSGTGKWRDALHSLHKGSSAPSYIQAGMLWVDDSAAPIWSVYLYDGTDSILIGRVNITDNSALQLAISLWDANITYAIGDYVKASDNKLYRALVSQSGNDPTGGLDPTNWLPFGDLLDENDFASDDDTRAPTQQSAKAYIDNSISAATPAATKSARGLSYLGDQRITIANNGAVSLDFSGGRFNFDDGSGQGIAPAYTKILNVAWSPGNGGGSVDVFPPTPNSWYYCFAIYNPTSGASDYLNSLSFSSPTLPAGYTKKRYIGPIRALAASIKTFEQRGKRFLWLDEVNDATGAPVIGLNLLTVPPAYENFALITYKTLSANGSWAVHYPGLTTPLSNVGGSYSAGNWDSRNHVELKVLTNSSGQVQITALGVSANGTHDIYTKGWDDTQLED